MKRKILSIILSLTMVFTMMPAMGAVAYAETTEADYLTFTALADGSSVTFNWERGSNVQSRLSDGDWTDYVAGTAIELNDGESVQFKGSNVVTYADKHFTMDGEIAASGSVTSLTDGNGSDPEVQIARSCYQNMFSDCTALKSAPKLPVKRMEYNCYHSMFSGCTGLKTAPELPSEMLESYCYQGMFSGCTSLETAPVLPAEALPSSCYQGMFSDCTSLETAPELPAETVKNYCYQGMFSGCTGLKVAPELLSESLDNYCYGSMFSGCTGLTSAPELPAEKMAPGCYANMFSDCTGLKVAPELPAETLAFECYANMFSGCTGLKTSPELPAETLASECYKAMFSGCTALTNAPELPATVLANGCYMNMFSNCTGIRMSLEYSVDHASEWSIPAGAATADNWNTGMLTGTSGAFTGNLEPGTVYYQRKPDPVSSASFDACAYDGKAQCPAATVESASGKVLTEGIHYTVTYENNIDAGTATAIVTGIGDFAGTLEAPFIIDSLELTASNSMMTLSTTACTYNGKAWQPAATLKTAVGGELRTLCDGTASNGNVKIAYSGNVNAGIATVTVTGIDNYTGTVTKTFKILPKRSAVSKAVPGKKKLTVKMKTKVASTGGATYQIAYKQKGKSKWKYITTTKQSKVIKKLKKGKRYYIKVRAFKTVSETDYYGAWSKTKLSKKIK